MISGIALEVVDGGWIEGVAISGIQMQRTRTPIFIRLGDRSRQHASARPRLRGVMIDGVHASEAILASSITGVPELLVEDVSLSNIRVENVLPTRQEWIGRVVPEAARGYPEARMFGMLPVSGLYARHVCELKLADISLRSAAGEVRPAILFDQVSGARITDFSSTAVAGAEPLIKVTNTKNTWISGSAAPAETGVFLGVEGATSEGIVVAAMKYGYTLSNPVKGTELPPEPIRERKEFPTFAELSLLIERLQEPISTAVWLVAVSSVRPNELAFKWKDLDVERRMLWVCVPSTVANYIHRSTIEQIVPSV